MNIKELEKLVETSFELKPGPLYIIGLNDSKYAELFSIHAQYLCEYLQKEGIKSIIVPASDIDKIYKLEKSYDK